MNKDDISPNALSQEKLQQDFCKGALDSIQNLINRMDVKAGIVMTVVGLLSTALYAFLAVAMRDGHIAFVWGIFRLVLIYFFIMAVVLWHSMRVFLARHAPIQNSVAPQMLFPLSILEGFKDDKQYASRAMKLTHSDIILDYSNQIIICSNIYKLKQMYTSHAISALRILLVIWSFLVVVTTWNIFSTISGK